jgi:hypothetical protein
MIVCQIIRTRVCQIISKTTTWAIHFYQKHGFEIVPTAEKEQLLRRYWTVPDRQIETSVVLADTTWRTLNPQ